MIKRVWVWFFLLAGLAAALPSCNGKKELEPDVLVMVNGKAIRVQDLKLAWLALTPEERLDYEGVKGMKDLLDNLITYRMMVAKAEEIHLDQDPDVKERLDRLRDQVLVNALVNQAVPEAELYRYYTEHFLRGRLIRVPFSEKATPAEKEAARTKAARIYEELKKGAKFEEVAKKESDDSTADQGGDMGYVTHDTISSMAGFQAAEALFALKEVNSYTPPVEGKNGYYIFQLVEPPGNLDPQGFTPDLRDNLLDVKKDEVFRSYANELNTRSDFKIERNDQALQNFLAEYQKAYEAQQAELKNPPGVKPGSTAVQPVPGATAAGTTAVPAPKPGATSEAGGTTPTVVRPGATPAPGGEKPPAVKPETGTTAKPAVNPGATVKPAATPAPGQPEAKPAIKPPAKPAGPKPSAGTPTPGGK